MTGHHPVPPPVSPPVPPAPPPAPAPRPRRRRPVLVVLAAVLAAGAAATGVVATALEVQDADRSSRTDVWRKPADRRAEGDAAKDPGVAAPPGGPLGAALLPMPDGYHLGPDIDGFGNDTVLTARQAEAVYKQSARGLPPEERRMQLDALADLELSGMAMRTYATDEFDLVAEVQLADVVSEGAAAGLTAVQQELARSLGEFEEGPEVEGHDSAACFMVPEVSGGGLDDGTGAVDDLGGAPLELMTCSAARGRMLVTLTAYGPDLDRERAAELLADQLDHIDAPGKSI